MCPCQASEQSSRIQLLSTLVVLVVLMVALQNVLSRTAEPTPLPLKHAALETFFGLTEEMWPRRAW